MYTIYEKWFISLFIKITFGTWKDLKFDYFRVIRFLFLQITSLHLAKDNIYHLINNCEKLKHSKINLISCYLILEDIIITNDFSQ